MSEADAVVAFAPAGVAGSIYAHAWCVLELLRDLVAADRGADAEKLLGGQWAIVLKAFMQGAAMTEDCSAALMVLTEYFHHSGAWDAALGCLRENVGRDARLQGAFDAAVGASAPHIRSQYRRIFGREAP